LGLFCILSVAGKIMPALQNAPKELMYIPYVLAVMFCGTVLRNLMVTSLPKQEKPLLLLAPVSVFGLPVMIMALHYFGIDLVDDPVRFGLSHSLGLALFLVGFFYIKAAQPFFLLLGTISYSVYLFRPIAITLILWLRKQDWAISIASLHMGIYMLMTFCVTILMASVAYKIIEKPGINLGLRRREQEPPRRSHDRETQAERAHL